jgi:hypothetical protein
MQFGETERAASCFTESR